MIIVIKVIIGTQGRINAILSAMNDFEFISAAPFGDGKVMITTKGEGGDFVPGEVVIKEVEVIKEIEVDNPEHIAQILVLKDQLADALNAEQAAKKEAEDLKKQIPKLKASVAKLKKALAED